MENKTKNSQNKGNKKIKKQTVENKTKQAKKGSKMPQNANKKPKEQKKVDKNNVIELKKALKEQKVLYGKIYAIQPTSKNVLIGIAWRDMGIYMSDEDFFEDTFRFNNEHIETTNFEDMPLESQLNKKISILQNMLKAEICFIPTHIQESNNTLSCKASRKLAMEKLRSENFITEPEKYKKGDIVDARILQVKHDRVLAECLGVETRIDVYNIAKYFVGNCHNAVSVGDKIKVRIRKLYVHDDNTVYLAISARLNDSKERIEKIKKNGIYIGIVDSFNSVGNSYSVRLLDGTPCMVRREDVIEYSILTPGDTVMFYVEKCYDEFILGKAKRIERVK